MAMRCQRICILSGGVVTATGSHDELVKVGGFYSRLVRQQMR
jgi:ABC-type multidrug transport system fused ATPase/permease subunit